MSSLKKEAPRTASAFSARRISGNYDVFNLLHREILGQKPDFKIDRVISKSPVSGKKKKKLRARDKRKLYAHFSSVSSTKPCEINKRAERIFNDLDRMVTRYGYAHENHTDHIILMGLMTLQDALLEDRPVSVDHAREALKMLAKDYQSDIHVANAMYADENAIQKQILSDFKNRLNTRYDHMPDKEDYETLALVARFSKNNSEISTSWKMYENSQFAQDDYYAFGVFRVQQIYAFEQWTKTPEYKRALELYKYLRQHKIDNKGQIPITKRLALHG